MNGNQNKQQGTSHRIAVWGPSGSGKTWLINAFGRSLMSSYAYDQNFSYDLREYTGEKIENPVMPFKPPIYEKTIEPIDFVWMFQRHPLQTSYAHQISSHTHILHIQDINGDDAFQLTDEIKHSLMGVDFLLLLLDPTCFSHDKNIDNNLALPNVYLENSKLINQEMYYYSVMQLLLFLTQTDASKLSIAVCLTKKDLWENDLKQDSVIRVQFGQQMEDLIKMSGLRFKLKVFFTTSCGYLQDVIREPNYDQETGWLQNVVKWKPEGVASPFFWFLENAELEKLQVSDGFFNFLTLERRVKKYIPYPTF